MSTFVVLQDEVLLESFDPTRYRPYVKTWINEGLKLIARRVPATNAETSTNVTTAAGTQSYALPSDFLRVRYVRNADDTEELEQVELWRLDEAPDADADPELFAISGTSIVFYPTPVRVVAHILRYWKTPATLTADGDIAAINPDYHYLLVSYARSRAFRSEDDPELASFHYAEFERDLAKLASDLSHPSGLAVRQIPGTWG